MPALKNRPTLGQSRTLKREIATASHREWLHAQEDKAGAFESKFAEWLKGISDFEKTATQNLYENQNFSALDLRFHRAGLAGLIADGESLALDGFYLVREGAVEQASLDHHTLLIDQHLDKLMKRLHEWHGALEDQADVPQSFKDGVKEIGEGKVVDMEKALGQKPQ